VSQKWLVLKFGGTSVRGLEQWQTIARRIEQCRAEGFRVLLVCSAVGGMTDLLEKIAAAPDDSSLTQAFVDRHVKFAADLGIDGGPWLRKAEDRLSAMCADLHARPTPQSKAALLALGEWLCTRLAWVWLNARFETEWVDARGLLEVVADPQRSERRRWLSADCVPGADRALLDGLNGCAAVVITQGFIAGMPGGGTALLGRGGSDTSAALLGGRIGAERVEIWTDVPAYSAQIQRTSPRPACCNG
jgi:diaminopimelate decarboxylase/aspartate kinase